MVRPPAAITICDRSYLRTGGWKQREKLGMLRSAPPPVLAMVPVHCALGRSLACS